QRSVAGHGRPRRYRARERDRAATRATPRPGAVRRRGQDRVPRHRDVYPVCDAGGGRRAFDRRRNGMKPEGLAVFDMNFRVSFLATVGSTSPYVGLFGTVWGIMNSFISLSGAQAVTIADVAPGIAEALIATAIGLFAAIPAVIAYNRYANNTERLVARYEIFT